MSNHLKRERTLVLIKPDGVQRGLMGEIVGRFERAGLKIVALKLVWPSAELAREHYPDDEEFLRSVGKKAIAGRRRRGIEVKENPLEIGKRIKAALERFLTTGPVLAMVVQGTQAVENVRRMVGSTDPLDADIGTIRGDLTVDSITLADLEARAVRNLIHASSSTAEAKREISLWFREEEIFDYTTVWDRVLYDKDWDKPLSGSPRESSQNKEK
jgi:nucleoside-diphosphate kinase